ncbi:MAG: type II toxin-antitoxin system HicA family toxin [Candidatus Thermoplasmatota archaeon]|nr:type II toxin-antitoxin system HicA family toxin [Candidatus Thermoplasmatota archaeon]
MAIDYSKLRSLTARKLVLALKKDGFSLVRQSGSHKIFRHPDRRRVTVSFHKGGQTFPIKLLKIMIEEQAKWNEKDLKRLSILK